MEIGDIIALVAVVASIVIGGIQIWQNKVKSDVKTDTNGDEQALKAAQKFIADHHDVVGLIPLCAVAQAYDPCFHYHREMYNEFLQLSQSVQRKIFECLGWTMCDFHDEDFMGYCMTLLEQAVSVFSPKDCFGRMFNEGGKYVKRAILYSGKDAVPNVSFEYEDGISDIVCVPFRDHRKDIPIIEIVRDRYNFGGCCPIMTYYIACKTAGLIAVYAGQNSTHENEYAEYGSPGGWSGEVLETMEDLFLSTLFEIWTSLHDVIEYDIDGRGSRG